LFSATSACVLTVYQKAEPHFRECYQRTVCDVRLQVGTE